MKNLIPIVLVLFSIGHLFGQSTADLKGDLEFDQESEERVHDLQIGEDVESLHFSFLGRISGGSLRIRIYDPNGKREGGFQLECIDQESEPGTSGTQNSNRNRNSNTNVSTGSSSRETYSYSYRGNSKGGSQGSMNKNIDKPIPGIWQVKIITAKATGKLNYKITPESK